MTQARAQATSSLDQSCTLRTPGAIASDGAGGWTNGADTDASVYCRVGSPTGREREIAAKLGREIDTGITLSWEVTVNTQQAVVCDGQAYEVVATNQHQSYRTATRVLARALA